MNYTDEQKRAIMCDKGNVLVSASAGSGKTFVMIQRLIRLILEGKTKVSNVLAVTFTNLAAAEMKEKLVRAITEKINAPDTDAATAERLKAELADIPMAAISTFHSLCNDLIKNYFYELGLDATFAVADEVQSDILRERAINGLFDRLYEEKNAALTEALGIFVRYRSDEFLKTAVLDLYDFFASEAYPEKFAEKAVALYSAEGYKKTETAFFAYYQAYFNRIDRELRAVSEEFEAIGAKRYEEVCMTLINNVEAVIGAKDLYGMTRAAHFADFRLPSVKINDEYLFSVKEKLKSLKADFTDEAKYLRSLFGNETAEAQAEKLIVMHGAAQALFDLCFAFEKEYSALKREENVVDFSDLEHFALELLDKDEIRKTVSSRYDYVFADEYQDTNGVQEEILSRIGRDNMFMVGDVKQSIYAFRGCNPYIFQNKFEKYLSGGGEALTLTANFRSGEEVIKCVNGIFSEIMTEETSGTRYAASPMTGGNGEKGYAKLFALRPAKTENADFSAKKGVYSVKANLFAPAADEAVKEGVLISSLIREITSIPRSDADGNGASYGYGDIVILLRSISGAYAKKIADALADNDIPVSSELKREVEAYPEIRHLVSLLRVIDCARQDVPLCAVMRGPTGGFTDAELALIRRTADGIFREEGKTEKTFGFFYEAVEKYRVSVTGELADKLNEFFAYIEKLRFLADYEGAGGILSRAVREWNIDLYYAARQDGKTRLKRINKLIYEASRGEKPITVKEFLTRLDSDADYVSVTEAGVADAVRIMSIHSSKGLEFPVVIVGGLHTKFNNSDISKELIKDREYGFSLKTYDLENMTVSTNLLREYLKKRYRTERAKEEMRVLYVALTRAKSRLYLTETVKEVPENATAADVLSAASYSKMISSRAVDVSVLDEDEINGLLVEKSPRDLIAGKADGVLKEAMKKNLSFAYPHDTASPAKSSVTSLLGGTETEGEYVHTLFPDEPDARTVGDAYHRFMELADFEKSSVSDVIAQKKEFIENGGISAEWAELIKEENVSRALQADFFHIPRAEYYRELPFEVLMPAAEVTGGGNDEVLVQGVIDIIAFTPEGIKIADYKVSSRSAEGLKKHYARQLELYAYAAEKITGGKVISKTLFNLKTGERVEL